MSVQLRGQASEFQSGGILHLCKALRLSLGNNYFYYSSNFTRDSVRKETILRFLDFNKAVGISAQEWGDLIP